MLWLADTLFGPREPPETAPDELQMDLYTEAAGGARAAIHYQIAATAGHGAMAALATLINKHRRGRDKRAAIRKLNALSDRLLRDIGLYRGEIRSAVTAMAADRPVAGSTAPEDTAVRPAVRYRSNRLPVQPSDLMESAMRCDAMRGRGNPGFEGEEVVTSYCFISAVR